MAVRSEAWIGNRQRFDALVVPAPASLALTRQARLARLQRRRRMGQAHAALEGVAWVAGSGAVVFLAFAGLFGLR
ncbi:MAG: hypothetical protein M3Z13_05285 [Candidatus Dormibacteraeota bacterium]|nr:hypothetical protein [Candidatus Dormibacteraeota bacterium]